MAPEGWTELTLGDLMSFKNGLNTEKENYGQGQKFVNVMDIFSSNRLHEKNIRGAVQISEKQAKEYNVQFGDILFNRTSETFDEIATSSVYLDEGNTIFGGGFVIRGRPSTDLLCTEHAVYFLTKTTTRKEIIRRGQGAVRANIGQRDLSKVPVSLPPKKEQTKIAQTLSTWDQAIETTEKLIENGKAQKKALMQQLLTGKKRFQEFVQSSESVATKYGPIPADWSFVAINEVAKDQVERAGKNNDYPVLSCSKYDGFVDSLKYFKRKVYSDDTSNYKVVRHGSFGFPSNHIEEGSLGYQDVYAAGIVSPIYSVFKTNDKVNDNYLYKLLKTDHYRQIFQASTNASVDRRGSLRWKEFGKIRIPLPSTEEQEKIAAVLSIAEQDISNLTQQLENLNRQKRALMQQLLTGKRRVKLAGTTS